MERRERREKEERGEGREVGMEMEMERDGASQHDRMTDGLTDEEGVRERQTLSMPPSPTSGSGVCTILASYTAS